MLEPLGFSKGESHAIAKLMQDEDTRFTVCKSVGRELINSKAFIAGNSLNQLILITSLAPFANDEQETVAVAVMIMTCIKADDILPSLECHKGTAFAARCLVSMGLFPQAMYHRYQFRGAPKPEFYEKTAIIYFHRAELDSIAGHFRHWTGFMSEHFL